MLELNQFEFEGDLVNGDAFIADFKRNSDTKRKTISPTEKK